MTLDCYFTKQRRFQVEEDGDLQDQAASFQSPMDEAHDSSTPQYTSAGESRHKACKTIDTYTYIAIASL